MSPKNVKRTIHQRKDLTKRDKEKVHHIAGASIPTDFFEWCNRYCSLNQHTTGNTFELSLSGPKPKNDTQSEFRNSENSSIKEDEVCEGLRL
ncbi:unnamed protein product [Caenorhabditis brenneri]